jgi:hypothetical protein
MNFVHSSPLGTVALLAAAAALNISNPPGTKQVGTGSIFLDSFSAPILYLTQPAGVGISPQRRSNRERRQAVGDKGKKDKDKGQKQKTSKQDQKSKSKLAKQPKRKP